ncbi:hypothetical protein, partial [Klebsiella sp. Kpp]|uniref:hypothetical protein n=1 Tax=Klebsiella sp. Kpp TaxID=2758578 RepID=UPI001C99C632
MKKWEEEQTKEENLEKEQQIEKKLERKGELQKEHNRDFVYQRLDQLSGEDGHETFWERTM